MTRFAFLSLLLLFIAGCQIASRSSQPTFMARTPQPATHAKQFWNKTARFLQPLMPDRSKHSLEPESRFALNHSHSDILPVNHTPQPLYRAGSIFPSPLLAAQQTEHETVRSAPPQNLNPLQIQPDDSEAFKTLLREIAVTPSAQWKVDDAKLAELLTSFRSETIEPDFEAEYLSLLRKRILPESESSKSTAPLPQAELAVMKRPVKNPLPKREIEEEYDEDFEDELLPPPAPKRKVPREAEPIIAQSTTSMSGPVYPSLTQLSTAAPAVTQTSYQTPYVPNAAVSSYGAGDWQAPARQTIEQLRYAIEQTPNGRTASNEIRLRLLEMILGNKTEAVRPMRSADETVNKFMGNQLLGFAALLDDTTPDSRGKYVSAAYRFNEGLMELQNLCPLKLKTVVLVDNFFDFGQYVPRATNEFHPGEAFLVYMELENLTVHKLIDGFEVHVAISYEIRDANAKLIEKQDAGAPGERSLSRKRDYRLGLGPCKLPTSLAPGQYYLRVTVADLNDKSMQYAEEQIPFSVIPASVTSEAE